MILQQGNICTAFHSVDTVHQFMPVPPKLAFRSSNHSQVMKTLDRLLSQWRAWSREVQRIVDHPYDKNTQTEVYADGESNMQKHELLQSKTLAFLDHHIEGHGFIVGVDGTHCDRTDLRLKHRVKHRVQALKVLRVRLKAIQDVELLPTKPLNSPSPDDTLIKRAIRKCLEPLGKIIIGGLGGALAGWLLFFIGPMVTMPKHGQMNPPTSPEKAAEISNRDAAPNDSKKTLSNEFTFYSNDPATHSFSMGNCGGQPCYVFEQGPIIEKVFEGKMLAGRVIRFNGKGFINQTSSDQRETSMRMLVKGGDFGPVITFKGKEPVYQWLFSGENYFGKDTDDDIMDIRLAFWVPLINGQKVELISAERDATLIVEDASINQISVKAKFSAGSLCTRSDLKNDPRNRDLISRACHRSS